MIRLVLRAINSPALILLFTIGVAIQTSLFATYPLMYLQPDVILLAVVWFSLRRGFTEGGVLTLILSNIAEVHSSAPQGLFMIAYMAIYLLVRLLSKLLVISHSSSVILLTLGASVVWKLTTLGVLHLMGLGANQWRHTLVLLLPGAVMVGVTAIWMYRFLEWFDWVTYKNAKARQMLEDELLLDGEGI